MFQLVSSNSKLHGLKLNTNITIGRSNDNDICIKNDEYLSSKHLEIIVKDGNSIFIKDLNSTNGSYLNGQKLEPLKEYPIKLGDLIILGSDNSSFKIELLEQEKTIKSDVKKKKNSNVLTIGRDKSNDIVIPHSSISSKHLKIVNENGVWYIEDLNSTNGTFLNSLDNKITKVPLKPNQILYIANYKIPTNKLLEYIQNEQVKKEEKISSNKEIITIGRDPKNDIVISHPSVSSHHAKLTKQGNEYYIEDLNSTNGTYVNGIEIKTPISVKNTDEIQVGVYSFILNIDDKEDVVKLQKENFIDGWILESKNIGITLPNGTKLLDDISFTIYPGELVGLMGLSGAGKTTLLKAMNGYTKPTEGTSLINGKDLYKNYNFIKSGIGYVPQDDIVHPELTVKEALKYYAKLRLPSDMTSKEIDILIDNTLEKLGLQGTQNTIIGSPDTSKGISGGQRKRVNLAMELLGDPQIIFLDEPTSGLSAVDTKMVMELLRQLADEGKTIIITIHQPSIDVYKLMDNVIILSFGKLAFYGRAYPDSIKFFNETKNKDDILNNPDNALIGLNDGEKEAGELELDAQKERNKKGKHWQEKYKNSKYYEDFVTKRTGEEKQLKPKDVKSSLLKQFFVLTSRYVNIKLKDIANTFILLVQAPLIGVMIAMLFSKQAYENMPTTLLFVLAISAIWFGTINASREIVAEKAIFERENMIGIGVVPYVMSKFIILAFLCFLQSITLVGIVEILPPFSIGVGSSGLLSLIWITFLTSLGGLSIGLLVSTIAKSQAQALALVPIVLLPMIIFGGGMMSVKQMYENPNKIAFYLSETTPTRWALEEMTRVYQKHSDPEQFCKNSEDFWKKLDSKNYEDKIGKSCSEVYSKYSPMYSSCESMFKKCEENRNFIETNYGKNSVKSQTIYIILSLFILLPLIFVMVILKRRYSV